MKNTLASPCCPRKKDFKVMITLPSLDGVSSLMLGMILNVIAPWDWAWYQRKERVIKKTSRVKEKKKKQVEN